MYRLLPAVATHGPVSSVVIDASLSCPLLGVWNLPQPEAELGSACIGPADFHMDYKGTPHTSFKAF